MIIFIVLELFKDEDNALLILKSHSPRDQKALGRKVRNFDAEVWTANCKEIVKAGNMAKVSYCHCNVNYWVVSMSCSTDGLHG